MSALWLTARPFPELLQALRQLGCPRVLVSLTGLVYFEPPVPAHGDLQNRATI